jgi:hypothetical protein
MKREICDRCGPTAYAAVSVSFPARSGYGLLTFCEHHAAQYVPNIRGANVCEIAPSSADRFDRLATREAAK